MGPLLLLLLRFPPDYQGLAFQNSFKRPELQLLSIDPGRHFLLNDHRDEMYNFPLLRTPQKLI